MLGIFFSPGRFWGEVVGSKHRKLRFTPLSCWIHLPQYCLFNGWQQPLPDYGHSKHIRNLGNCLRRSQTSRTSRLTLSVQTLGVSSCPMFLFLFCLEMAMLVLQSFPFHLLPGFLRAFKKLMYCKMTFEKCVEALKKDRGGIIATRN